MALPAIGATIQHAKLGGGKVVSIAGDKLTILFDDGVTRQLLARFVTWSPEYVTPAAPSLLQQMLGAIFAAPEDDAARLVYADALSERGDPRGELISVQCKLTAPELDPAQRSALEAREAELIQRWRQILSDRYDVLEAEIERGFLRHAKMEGDAFAQTGAALFAAEPIQRLTLHFQSDRLIARIVATPGLERLRELALVGGDLPGPIFAALAAAPRLQDLHTLDIGVSRVARWSPTIFDDEGALALARWPHRQLRCLKLSHCQLSPTQAEHLGESAHLASLERLFVYSYEWPKTIVWLSALLRGLTRLPCVEVRNTDDWVRHVLRAAGFSWVAKESGEVSETWRR